MKIKNYKGEIYSRDNSKTPLLDVGDFIKINLITGKYCSCTGSGESFWAEIIEAHYNHYVARVDNQLLESDCWCVDYNDFIEVEHDNAIDAIRSNAF